MIAECRACGAATSPGPLCHVCRAELWRNARRHAHRPGPDYEPLGLHFVVGAFVAAVLGYVGMVLWIVLGTPR